MPCGAGTTIADGAAAASACTTTCPADKYCPANAGYTVPNAPTSCPTHTTSATGSNEITDCVSKCESFEYWDTVASACKNIYKVGVAWTPIATKVTGCAAHYSTDSGATLLCAICGSGYVPTPASTTSCTACTNNCATCSAAGDTCTSGPC